MKYAQIKAMKKADLEKHLKEINMELIKLNSQVATGTPPENPGKIKELRRTVARIKTALKNNA